MTASLLTTHGLSKNFGETTALQDVSIKIEAGRVQTILGENGSGKSTLAKILAGIIAPDSGEIRIDNAPARTATPAAMIKLGITMVLQEVLVAPNRTILDNILMGQDSLLKHCCSRGEKIARVSSLLSGLTARIFDLDTMAGDLELHEQQIIVIARGFARNPRLLILDEATAALDLADREMLFAAIRRFSDSGGAVVFVSHRMPEILALSDVVYVMHNGRNTAKLSGSDINSQTLLAHLTQEIRDA